MSTLKIALRGITTLLVVAAVCCMPMGLYAEDAAQVTKEAEKSAKEGAPKIVFTSLEHDFGKVNQNTKHSYTFTFKNEGTAFKWVIACREI